MTIPETHIWLEDCERLLLKYGGHGSHSGKVARLADRLFTAMQAIHELPEAERAPLVAAALLHDVGHAIDSEQHHRHSRYLIRHDQGLAHWPEAFRERVALLALNHRRPLVKGIKALKGQERDAVLSQVAMLRLADWLDRPRDHRVEVHDVRFVAESGAIVFALARIRAATLLDCADRKAGLAATHWDATLQFVCDDQIISVEPQR
jgi:exopolyphosphatase/pppGpp-phosphohydrolase